MRDRIAGIAKSLSSELAPEGILINTLGPRRIATERSAGIDRAQAEKLGVPVEEVRGRMEAQIPLGPYGTPEEFARIAYFGLPGEQLRYGAGVPGRRGNGESSVTRRNRA